METKIEERIAAGIDVAEKFPEVYRTVILQELLRGFSLDQTAEGEQLKAKHEKTVNKKSKSQGPNGPTPKILELAGEGFFQQHKSDTEVMDELKIRGFHFARSSVSARLLELVQGGRLKRVRAQVGKRKVFQYQTT